MKEEADLDLKETFPLVSIITIVFNSEKFLQETISSVINQTYKNIEYIVIDGGSTDSTLNIIKKNEKYISKWISEKDHGISDAFNKGIRLSNGILVGIINSDDWLERDAIELIVKNYSFNNSTILCGNVLLHNSKNNYALKRSTIVGIRSKMTIWHPGMFVPKAVYDDIGLYNIDFKILMDYDFVIRCYMRNIKFEMLDINIANMRFGGVSNTLINQSMREGLVIKNKYFDKKLIHYLEYCYFNIYFQSIIFIKKLIY